MGLIERLFGGESKRSLPSWFTDYFRYGANSYNVAGFSQTLQGANIDIDSSFRSLTSEGYKSNGIVFACMRVRQEIFSEARFRFRRRRDGKPGDLFSKPSLRILERPWPGGTTGDLLSRAITYADLAGTAIMVRTEGQIRCLRPDWCTLAFGVRGATDATAELIGVGYWPGGRHAGKEPEKYYANEVAVWSPIPDPTSPFRGMSPLTPVIREIMGDSATTDHKLRYFEQGATPNLAIVLEPTVTLADAREWIELFKQDHEGTLNAFKTVFLGGGATPHTIGSDLKNIDFKAVQGAGETRIAAAFGTPPIVVGLSEGLASATYSNYGQARRAFADLTMRPLWRSFAGALGNIVDVPSDAELWYDDSDISFLQEDIKDAADILQVKATIIGSLLREGFTAESAVAYAASGDVKDLEHRGPEYLSVQLQEPKVIQPELALPSGTNGKTPEQLTAGTR